MVGGGLIVPPAQIDTVVNHFPGVLGPVFVFFGLELMLVGTFEKVLRERGLRAELSDREHLAAVGGLAVGLLFAASGALRLLNVLDVYVILLFCLGRAIEGVGAVRFYRRVIDTVQGKSNFSGFGDRIKYGLFLLFVTFLAVWLGFRILTEGPLVGSTAQSLRLVWTGFVVLTVGVGIARKLGYADADLNRGLKSGMILAVVGAELFNLGTVSMELAAFIAGSVAFSIGFGVAVYLLLGDILLSGGSKTASQSSVCDNCGSSVDPQTNYCSRCGSKLS